MKPYMHSLCNLLLFFCLAASAAPKLIDRTAVVVNDEAILESDIDKFQQKLKMKSFQELFGGVDPSIANNREAVMQLLVEEKLINQHIKKIEMQATEQEVDGQIKAIIKRNGITESQLGERLKQLGTSLSDYKEGIKRQIERKNLMDREIRPSMEISEDQLKHFYLRNAPPGEKDLVYKIAHIFIATKGTGAAAATAETRAKNVYTALKEKPEDFDKLVKESSDDSSSTESGGVLGEFSLSQLSKEFKLVIPKTKEGEFTAPIKTSSGFHIVKVLEVKSSDFASLSKDKKDMLKNQMIGQELEKKMSLWLERKKSESYIKRFDK